VEIRGSALLNLMELEAWTCRSFSDTIPEGGGGLEPYYGTCLVAGKQRSGVAAVCFLA